MQLALSATIGFTSCSQGKAEKNLRSAYYWSTTWQLDSNKMNFIQKHHINRIYVRYFDVYIARPQFLFVTYLIISRYTKIQT